MTAASEDAIDAYCSKCEVSWRGETLACWNCGGPADPRGNHRKWWIKWGDPFESIRRHHP